MQKMEKHHLCYMYTLYVYILNIHHWYIILYITQVQDIEETTTKKVIIALTQFSNDK